MPVRDVKIGACLHNKIYHMDCFDLMKKLPNESVQLILTDPPYGIRYQNSFTRERLPYLAGDTGIDYPLFAQESYRILQNNSHAYFFTRFDQYPYHFNCLAEAGFLVKNCLIVEKGSVGGIGDLYGSYANNCVWIIFCQKGRHIFNNTQLLRNVKYTEKTYDSVKKIVREYKTRLPCCWFGNEYPKATYNSSQRVKSGYKHPTMKNAACLEWLIQISTNPGEIVFDPLMGTGSTAVAAINANRFYLGSEVDASYWQLSQNRISGIRTGNLEFANDTADACITTVNDQDNKGGFELC